MDNLSSQPFKFLVGNGSDDVQCVTEGSHYNRVHVDRTRQFFHIEQKRVGNQTCCQQTEADRNSVSGESGGVKKMEICVSLLLLLSFHRSLDFLLNNRIEKSLVQ